MRFAIAVLALIATAGAASIAEAGELSVLSVLSGSDPLRDELAVDEEPPHSRCVARPPRIQGTVVIREPGIIPRALGVSHDQQGLHAAPRSRSVRLTRLPADRPPP